jgi:uncharacterized protein with PIN domain
MMSQTDWVYEKFIVDHNVGHLAKWMRFLGFDTHYFKGANSKELLRIARREDRAILTRNSRMIEAELETSPTLNIPILLLESQHLEDQIRQIIETFHLNKRDFLKSPLTRCSLCNTPLQKVTKESVKGRVPLHVFETQEEFYFCSTCEKYYWKGTHYDKMMVRIKRWNRML